MRIERDQEHDLLYIELLDGEVEETVDLAAGVHADIDDRGNVVGVEFLSLSAFENYMDEKGGEIELPVWIDRRELGPVLTEPSTIKPAVLTQRQLEVLKLIAHGMTNRQIAESLDLSVNAVKRLVGSILKHLRVSNRTEAAIRYLQQAQNTTGDSGEVESREKETTDSVA